MTIHRNKTNVDKDFIWQWSKHFSKLFVAACFVCSIIMKKKRRKQKDMTSFGVWILCNCFSPIIYHIAKFALCTSILENIQWKTDSQLLNWLATSISLGAFKKKGGGDHMEQHKKNGCSTCRDFGTFCRKGCFFFGCLVGYFHL